MAYERLVLLLLYENPCNFWAQCDSKISKNERTKLRGKS